MRTTVRIDDDLLRDLRQCAAAERISMSRLLNQLLRRGLASKPPRRAPDRERVYSLGEARFNLDQALAVAAADEDAEVIRELALRK